MTDIGAQGNERYHLDVDVNSVEPVSLRVSPKHRLTDLSSSLVAPRRDRRSGQDKERIVQHTHAYRRLHVDRCLARSSSSLAPPVLEIPCRRRGTTQAVGHLYCRLCPPEPKDALEIHRRQSAKVRFVGASQTTRRCTHGHSSESDLRTWFRLGSRSVV